MARTVVPARLAASRATSPSSPNASGAIPGRANLLENEGFQEPSKWGLHLVAVSSGRGAARWSGLPELLRRAACLVQRGLEVPGLSGLAALALSLIHI